MLLADGTEIEALKSLSANWPMLTILLVAMGWFAKFIAQPLTTRHLAYLDSSSEIDRKNTETSIKQTAILETLTKEVAENNDRLSTMREMMTAHKRRSTQPL